MSNIIHADKLLAQSHMLEFSKNLTDDTIITMFVEQTGFCKDRPFSEMREFFLEDLSEYIPDDDCVIQFVPNTENPTILQIIGYDWYWWRKPFRKKAFGRIDQYHLFDKEIASKEKKEKTTAEPVVLHTIRIGCKLPDNTIEEYDILTGTNKQLIAFVNTKYAEVQLKTQFEAIPVFAIDNDTTWYEFDELVEKGIFVK